MKALSEYYSIAKLEQLSPTYQSMVAEETMVTSFKKGSKSKIRVVRFQHAKLKTTLREK